MQPGKKNVQPPLPRDTSAFELGRRLLLELWQAHEVLFQSQPAGMRTCVALSEVPMSEVLMSERNNVTRKHSIRIRGFCWVGYACSPLTAVDPYPPPSQYVNTHPPTPYPPTPCKATNLAYAAESALYSHYATVLLYLPDCPPSSLQPRTCRSDECGEGGHSIGGGRRGGRDAAKSLLARCARPNFGEKFAKVSLERRA